MSSTATLVWFRQDLRLADNAALHAALERGGAVVPVYIWDEAGEGAWKPGPASRWWLQRSLTALHDSLRTLGSRLTLARGDSLSELERLVSACGAGAVYWNRRYEPAARRREAAVEQRLRSAGVEVRTFNSALLFEPHEIQNRQGNPFQVFTPFWRTCLARETARPLPAPRRLPAPSTWPETATWTQLEPGFSAELGRCLSETWTPGEAAARRRLQRFLKQIAGYADDRDMLSMNGSSTLSPFLHYGEVGPRQVWAAVRQLSESSGVFPAHGGAQKFLGELGWREFSHHLLFHFPHTPEQPLRRNFERFPWAADPGDLRLTLWQQGRTGYPVVDAGMRQLRQTGWMPNRARMIAASFLVKHLLLPWQKGAAWFWDNLVDADLANNTLGWQWVAGSGADASPFFRIFAPVLQGQKFDPRGEYVKRWLPELANLPARFVHAPWTAPPAILRESGVVLGEHYPMPVVDHASARDAALAAYRRLSAD